MAGPLGAAAAIWWARRQARRLSVHEPSNGGSPQADQAPVAGRWNGNCLRAGGPGARVCSPSGGLSSLPHARQRPRTNRSPMRGR